MMDYKAFDLSKIKYSVDEEQGRIKIGYDKYSKIKIITPILTIPFGIEYAVGKYYMKLQFTDYKNNSEMEEFLNTMVSIENNMTSYIHQFIDKDAEIASEFKYSTIFDPMMNSKLISFKKSVKTKIITTNGSDVPYTYLQKKDRVKCVLELNGIWKYKNKFCYKWAINEMKLIE